MMMMMMMASAERGGAAGNAGCDGSDSDSDGSVDGGNKSRCNALYTERQSE